MESTCEIKALQKKKKIKQHRKILTREKTGETGACLTSIFIRKGVILLPHHPANGSLCAKVGHKGVV